MCAEGAVSGAGAGVAGLGECAGCGWCRPKPLRPAAAAAAAVDEVIAGPADSSFVARPRGRGPGLGDWRGVDGTGAGWPLLRLS